MSRRKVKAEVNLREHQIIQDMTTQMVTKMKGPILMKGMESGTWAKLKKSFRNDDVLGVILLGREKKRIPSR